MTETGAEYEVKQVMRAKLEEFDERIAAHPDLEIDGSENDSIKVLCHDSKSAFNVPVRTIMMNPVKDIITALAEGVFDTRLHSISRIVGYFSRINNWSRSKISELEARNAGNYWETSREQTKEKSEFFANR